MQKRKMVTITWKNICIPYSKGGLGLHSLVSLNEASNFKLCWGTINSHEAGAIPLRSCVLRNSRVINHHIFSYIWTSIKLEYPTIKNNYCSMLGNDKSINLWSNVWCGPPLRLVLEDSIID